MTSDRLSEEQVVASAGRVVATIVEGFCPELHVRGLTARSLPPRLTAGNGAGATGNVRNASIRRWAITPQRQAIPIELVSIATSDATTVSHNASVRAHQPAVRS
jgi:hypothetical protein